MPQLLFSYDPVHLTQIADHLLLILVHLEQLASLVDQLRRRLEAIKAPIMLLLGLVYSVEAVELVFVVLPC
jgi:hypothetical protein